MFDQIHKMNHGIYGRISAGLLEVQYAGLDGEVAVPLFKEGFMQALAAAQ